MNVRLRTFLVNVYLRCNMRGRPPQVAVAAGVLPQARAQSRRETTYRATLTRWADFLWLKFYHVTLPLLLSLLHP